MLKRISMLVIPLCAACYSYQPIRPADATKGMSVHADISKEMSARIAPLLGIADLRSITGTVIDNNNGTMIVEVPTVVQAGENNAVQSLYQRVTVPPGDVLGLQSRRLARTRTALLVCAAAVAVGSYAVSALKGEPGIDSPSRNTTGTETRIPIFRFFF
ncbi:MAG TPA: hypothetical protein VGM67_03345 [Gemmatimonadaceae bacterium]|jgi:hypothetical protein